VIQRRPAGIQTTDKDENSEWTVVRDWKKRLTKKPIAGKISIKGNLGS
jgi:hypothetical protein